MEYRCPFPQVFQETGSTHKTWQSMQLRFTTYLTTYNNHSQQNSLLYFLAGQEIEVLINSLAPDYQQSVVINQFLFSLENSCLLKFLLLFQRFQFFSSSQDKGESICQFISRLSDLADCCEFGDLHNILIRDQILSGLADEGIRQILSQAEELDRYKAEKICHQIAPCPYSQSGICTVHNRRIVPQGAESIETGTQNKMSSGDTAETTSIKLMNPKDPSPGAELKLNPCAAEEAVQEVSPAQGDGDDGGNTMEDWFPHVHVQKKKKKKLWKRSQKEGLVGALFPSKDGSKMSSSLDELVASNFSNFRVYHQSTSRILYADVDFSKEDERLIQIYDKYKDIRTDFEFEQPYAVSLDLASTEGLDDKLIAMVDCEELENVKSSQEHDRILDKLLEFNENIEEIDFFAQDQNSVIPTPTRLGGSTNFDGHNKKKKSEKAIDTVATDQTSDSHICDVCGKKYATALKVRAHVKRVHRHGPHSCQVCGKSFIFPSGLQMHMRYHTGERNYVCEICGHRFVLLGELTRHLEDHAGIKRHECPYCHQKFSQKHAMKVHIRKHTGEKPFVCEVCLQGFIYKHALTTHMMQHTGEKPYKCDTCGKGFTTSTHLHRHKRLHSGFKPHSCHICNSEFTRLSNLNYHRRAIHGLQPWGTVPDGPNLLQSKRM